ncbi:MAG: hypothetical protein UW07_C0003G0011 [Candidatus Nomurabacteria bacterium GW2011_GWF2_43_8]|uniref:Baseplate protein J-like domain-containing protein n=3 Tax=Candidatus Nomuraibacteriota TaxID=1752729 RepID=A0A0G1IPF2_9BACT|nr:MAG: hypothetical protein UV76_C0005G0011 [Candidatus Nomurabacteria bacterium GW2011_GWA2_43_15]KKT19030.1 MAG: hypothetical protein UW02_C0016G0004 [Candidatus Nomurabacteria bacterium GW2011_GWB1_43_7]KKT25069.1 MAG: hypothetical protein UW07_C0003G0011 [Candidatus Nomurabacteria bacterium GW2011_GWF2_43_8]
MSKHFLEDMIKDKRRRMGTEKVRKPELKEVWEEPEEAKEIKTSQAKNRPRYMLWLVALISAAFCFFALSFLFSKAEVLVDPKAQDVSLNENLSASKDSSDNGLFFDLVVISGEESKSVPASGEKDVTEKATGTVVIYNAFSSSSQTLSIDTRLEGSNGKIYKTQAKTVVPGKSSSGTPGSVEVKIYGAEAGPEYNSEPLDFKILGFKGTSKYDKFYGRSKGAIAGGFKGRIPDVPETEKTAAVAELKTALQAKLLQKATDQIPSGFVLFKDAVFLNIDDTNIPLDAENNNLIITLKGTLYGLLFNEQKLTKKIAEKNVERYDGNEVFIPNIKELVFMLSNKDSSSFDNIRSVSFNLSGPAKIVWKLDADKFAGDLLGKPKKDFNQILSQYTNIDSATLTLSPLWARSIPNQAEDVSVIVNYPK